MRDVENPDKDDLDRVGNLIYDLSKVISLHIYEFNNSVVAVEDALNAARHLYAKTVILVSKYDSEVLNLASIDLDKTIAKIMHTKTL